MSAECNDVEEETLNLKTNSSNGSGNNLLHQKNELNTEQVEHELNTEGKEEDTKNMEPYWSLSPRAIVAGFLVLLGVLIFHPTMVNLLVRSENSEIPLVYVNNFYLWTRRHPGLPQHLVVGSRASILSTQFYPRKTYVVVHGFLGSGLDEWIVSMKDALLYREDCNVISVSWNSGTVTLGYPVIQQRVPDVGDDISKLLKFLDAEAGLTSDLVHLIGHSLGAHAVGFAGKKMNGSLLRITGLDPAGLLYHQTDMTKRLDKSDASFVDVIHTHGCTTLLSQWSDCYGIDENIGDADFWPNGGSRQTLPCTEGNAEKFTKNGSSCDHSMAYILYTESILYPSSTTKFLARPCMSYADYLTGSCLCSLPGRPVQYMGYNANPHLSGVFYLTTNKFSPFARLDSDCPSGSFSMIQLISLVLLSILTLLMMFIVVAAVVQQYYGIPILTRLSVGLGIDCGTWHGFPRSSSSELLTSAAGEEVIT